MTIWFIETHTGNSLKQQPINSEKLSEALEKLTHQTHRAGAIIERMQKMTKPGERKLVTTDGESLVRDVHNLAQVEAKRRQFIIVLDLEKPLPKVHCDPIQIQQVVLNLLQNGMDATEAMEGKGSTARNGHLPRSKKVILAAEMKDQMLCVSIIDRGIGIADDIAKQLYQPFTTTKASGMGLGLSISQSIVSAHGGKLEFKNNIPSGTTFSCLLPVANVDD